MEHQAEPGPTILNRFGNVLKMKAISKDKIAVLKYDEGEQKDYQIDIHWYE